MLQISPAKCILRGLRLLDPYLSDLRPRRVSEEHEWLALKLLSTGQVDEQRTAEELAQEVILYDMTPLHGLLKLAKELVEIRNGTPVCRDQAIWHYVGRCIDTDLIIAACLARRQSPPVSGSVLAAASWPSVLGSGGFALEIIVNRELVDGHVHLGGALPGTFYWLAAMTGFAHLDRVLAWDVDTPTLWYQRLIAMQDLRRQLIRMLWGNEPLTLQPRTDWTLSSEHPEEAFVDPILEWLVPDPTERSRYNPVLGERFLLWAGLAAIFRGTNRSMSGTLFLEYLRSRNSFIRRLTHDHGVRGLHRFQKTFRSHHLVFADTHHGERINLRKRRRARRAILKLERFRVRHALRYQFSDPTDAPWARDFGSGLQRRLVSTSSNDGLVSDQPIPSSAWRAPRQVELRVTPVASPFQARIIHAYLKGVDDFIRYDLDAPPIRVGFIFHVLRQQDIAVTKLEAQTKLSGFLSLLEAIPEIRPFVVGIDAAGEETLMPNRELAPVFLKVKEMVSEQLPRPGAPPIRIGRTIHAGEDFRDLLTGIRCVDEAVSLLCLEPGERVGHGMALAFDPLHWYRGRSHVYPLRRDHLLDLIWALFIGRLSQPEIGLKPVAEIEHSVRVLLEAQTQSVGFRKATHIIEHLDDADWYQSDRDILRDLGVRWRDCQSPITVRVDDHYLELVSSVRERVLRRIEESEVVIEVCPTSNLLVSALGSYERLPYLNLNQIHLAEEDELPQISFSINSDDPGVFQTTVANEYRVLGRAMINKGFRRRKVLAWLEEARQVGVASTFIPPWSPPTREELMRAIDDLDRFGRSRR
jgi:hypothetical protein